MADPLRNFFKSTLVGTYSDSDTSITVATGDGALLPDPSVDGAFNLTIFEGLQVNSSTTFEIVRVTARSGDVLTVTRGQESTTPLTIGSATHSILMSATKKTFDDINTAIDNVNVTTLTGVEELTFDSTGDEEFGLPVGTTAQRPSSPSAGYMRYNTSDGIGVEVYNGNRWVSLGAGFAQLALEVAELSVTANDAVAENVIPLEVEYLVIAGGGGGGKSNRGGGGGAGGYRSSVSGESSGGGASAESPLELDSSANYSVTVGAGGSGGDPAVQGSSSSFATISTVGGGRGGSNSTQANSKGGDGGSGGGGSEFFGQQPGGSGTANQGFDGADSTPSFRDGGGGGAASAATTGDGGDGLQSSITGASVFRAGGGDGGETSTNGTNGQTAAGDNGLPNSGSGGGGGNSELSAGTGGSGVVILRYPSKFTISIGAGLTGSETTVGANKVATITAGTGNVSWT